MIKNRFFLISLCAVLISAFASPAAYAAPADPDKGRGKHDAVVTYWTPDRVSKAKPREIAAPGEAGVVAPQKPAAGKPSGGGGSSSTGASWTKGGLVKATVGKALFTMAGVDYVCSGTVVQDSRLTESLVLTAGHCVYDQVDGWATNWMFMPDFDSAPSAYKGGFNCAILPYGCWTTDSLITSAGWAAGNFNEDYAFAVVTSEGHTALLEDTVGAQAIAFSGVRPASVYAFGYPHASPYKVRTSSTATARR